MDKSQILLFTVGLVLVLGVQSSLGIKCYNCNSHYDKEKCEDVTKATDDEKVDCDDLGLKDGVEYKYCRKISQSVEGEDRTVRQCATEGEQEPKCIARTGTKNIKVTYCKCEGDYCNTAPAAASSLILLTLMSGLLAFIFHS